LVVSTGSSEAPRSYRQVLFSPPAGSTEIYLVRHGESALHDPEHPFELVEGRGDPALSPFGRAQAAALAERLESVAFEAVYVTPLRRTRETAAPLLERTGLEAIVEAGLIEVHMGEWEGGRYRERIAVGDPLIGEVFAEQRWELIPGGESNASLFSRTASAISEISRRHAGGRILVVAHGISISAVLARATHSDAFAFVGADNASISVVVAAGEHLILRRFNDTAHLESLGPCPA
jgi:probable phosphoglycerate mutase